MTMNQPNGLPASRPGRVLVVTDQPLIAELVKLTLHHAVYDARAAQTVPEATTILHQWRPQLAVVDMDIVGDQFIQQVGGASTGTRIPLLALTRRGDLKTKLAAFDQGVDDIMTVPFSPEELLARILAISRRTYGELPTVIPTLKLGDLEIDILHRQVRINSSELHLTGLEQSLLYLLAANAGRLLTRDEILDTIWGTDFVAESNVVDRHVRSLRAKLQNGWRRPRYIATVPGRGYRFIPALIEESPLQ